MELIGKFNLELDYEMLAIDSSKATHWLFPENEESQETFIFNNFDSTRDILFNWEDDIPENWEVNKVEYDLYSIVYDVYLKQLDFDTFLAYGGDEFVAYFDTEI